MNVEGRLGNGIRSSVAKGKALVETVGPFVGYHKKDSDANQSRQHFGDKIPFVPQVAEFLIDHGVTPLEVTVVGLHARRKGSRILGRFPQKRKEIEERTGKRPKDIPLALSGVLYWGGGMVLDALDGVMAEKHKDRRLLLDPAPGRVADGIADYIAVNTLPLDILKSPEDPHEFSGWKDLPFFNGLATGIRSSAVGSGVEMNKAATGSQAGIEAILLGSHIFEIFQKERARGHIGAIVTFERALDAARRYYQVILSGDPKAIKTVNADVIQIAAIQIVSSKMSDNPDLPFLLNGVKLADMMWGEANGGKRPSSMVVDRGIEIFNEGRRRLAQA